MSCASGFAKLVRESSTSYYWGCAPGPTSAETRTCTPGGGTCWDSTGSYAIKDCMCSYSGKGYCPPFQGDQVFLNVVANVRALQRAGVSCFNSEITDLCVMNDPKILQIYYYYYTNWTFYMEYANVQDADQCIKEIFGRVLYGLELYNSWT